MRSVIYKLMFKAPVHFGSGRLTTGNNVFFADTLFSALCHEAVKIYGESGTEKLFDLAKNGELLLSDGMPYSGDMLLVPKPIIHIEGERESNSSMKKKFKKLKYIPINEIGDFMSGSYDPTHAADIELGQRSLRRMVAVHEDKDNEPYSTSVFTFADNCGLYFIARVSDNDTERLLRELMTSLSYTGIGGKVSAGLGSFKFDTSDLTKELEASLDAQSPTYMSLSVSMATEDELDSVVDGACYEMIKRGGFVTSETYSDNPLKKADFYCFKGGSCFTRRFNGDVFDVSRGGAHPVYRYAKPMLIAIGKRV